MSVEEIVKGIIQEIAKEKKNTFYKVVVPVV